MSHNTLTPLLVLLPSIAAFSFSAPLHFVRTHCVAARRGQTALAELPEVRQQSERDSRASATSLTTHPGPHGRWGECDTIRRAWLNSLKSDSRASDLAARLNNRSKYFDPAL
eukprot:39274-Prymnesium_polylepis.1